MRGSTIPAAPHLFSLDFHSSSAILTVDKQLSLGDYTMTTISTAITVSVGKKFSCKYPQHGTRNVLCNQIGVVEKIGDKYVCIKREDGTYRSLRIEKMVEPVIEN